MPSILRHLRPHLPEFCFVRSFERIIVPFSEWMFVQLSDNTFVNGSARSPIAISQKLQTSHS